MGHRRYGHQAEKKAWVCGACFVLQGKTLKCAAVIDKLALWLRRRLGCCPALALVVGISSENRAIRTS